MPPRSSESRRGEHERDPRPEHAVGERVAVDPDLVGRQPRVGVARDAERVQDADGRPQAAAQLPAAQRRELLEDERLRALPQQPDRIPGRVAVDHPAGRRRRVAIDAGELQRPRVHPHGVEGEVAQDDGMVGRHGVEVLPGGQPARVRPRLVEQREVPAAAADPRARRHGGGRPAHRGADLGDRLDRGEAHVQRQRRERQAGREAVHVGVVDPGQRRAALEVDHPRAAPGQPADLARRPRPDDPAAAHGDRLRDAIAAVERVHLAVEEDEVGRLGLRRPGGRRRKGQAGRRGGAGPQQRAAGEGVGGADLLRSGHGASQPSSGCQVDKVSTARNAATPVKSAFMTSARLVLVLTENHTIVAAARPARAGAHRAGGRGRRRGRRHAQRPPRPRTGRGRRGPPAQPRGPTPRRATRIRPPRGRTASCS